MRKSDNSYLTFQNDIDQPSVYLSSYSFEMYLKLVAYIIPGQKKNQINYQATLLDCSPHSQINISHTKITFMQYGGDYAEYTFNQTNNEFQAKFLSGQWVHLSFSYNNYSTSINLMMMMRIHLNGELIASRRVSTPSKTPDSKIGNGLCYFGNNIQNARTNLSAYDSTLNADVSYLLINDQARQLNNFSSEVFMKYPSANTIQSRSLMYFKLDEPEFYLVDYHLNRTIGGVTSNNLTFETVQNRTNICQCQGMPLNVLSIKRGRENQNSQSIILKNNDSVTTGFTLDFWILIYDDLEYPTTSQKPQRMIINSDKFVKIGTIKRDPTISIGDTSQYTQISNTSLYYRGWINLAFQLKSDRKVYVYKNGQRTNIIGQQGTIKQNNTQFQILHEITMKLYRVRLLNQNSTALTDTFFYYSYLSGSTNNYNAFTNLNPQNIIFDFVMADIYFETFQYRDFSYVDGSISYSNARGNKYSWTFNTADFKQDLYTCGEEPTYINGICQDNRWFPYFVKSNQANEIFQNNIWCIARNLTYEMWFKVNLPANNQNVMYLMQVIDSYSKIEKFALDFSFENKTNVNYYDMRIGTPEIKNGTVNISQTMKISQWYHLTWKQNTDLKQSQTTITYYSKYNENELTSITYLSQGYFDLLTDKSLAQMVLGNNIQGNAGFLGAFREFRIWYEYRNDQDISYFRNIEIPVLDNSISQNLAYYYRLVGESNYLQLTQLSNYYSASSDITLLNTRSTQSQIRFDQDYYLHICPYGSYLNDNTTSCINPSQINVQFTAYQNYQYDKQVIFDSLAKFENNDR
ncbi:UNKNOWN [Stylonychia lemnae]|uniref:Uncharacterized protein n=1 Tax=Stylonychia lemnae TaxID=5949 RepID=A0A078B3M3_STYLE|nr:UNKNOWN [Stylonychia lemnae]|eukprot:CDW89054.1 UNKNOWN [Stylonychia lemnae]